jgi:hypothetical protein
VSTTQPPLMALDTVQTVVDLVPERRAPPSPTAEQAELPFDDIMSQILRGSRNVNPFY